MTTATESKDFLTDADKIRLKKVASLSEPLSNNDLQTIYYHLHVNSMLEKSATIDSGKICSHVQSQQTDLNVETIYFLTSISKLLSNCQLDTAKIFAKLQTLAGTESTVLELYRIASSLANLGKPIDSAKFSKLLVAAMKRDETLLNTGLAFQLASKFSKAEDRNVFVEKIGDTIVQADEINGKLLQFEGGLGVSAAIVNGIYQLATASNKPIGITNEQALKLVNYFLSRKYVLTAKGASEVIESLSLFANNKYHIPLIVSKYGSSSLSAENSILTIKVTNVLGLPVGPVTVTGTTLTPQGEKTSLLKDIAFKPVTGDSTLFAYDFFEKPLPSGFYSLKVNAIPTKSDSRIFGNSLVEIKLSILTQVDIVNAELNIADSETGSRSNKLSFPSAISETLEADYSQRIQLKFQLKDRLDNSKNVRAHQAFLHFHNEQTKQEIVFIAEQDSLGTYKVDLNLQVRSKDFNNLSGKYKLSLIIGDALVMNSINWQMATIQIQFSAGSQPTSTGSSTSSEYTAKPEIRHIFREQEKRPHPVVSNFFTFLVMLPFVGLFVMWFKIGINFSRFQFSLSAILFHTSLALIFLLYACFFIQLNMFQTVKYLAGFSLLAYLSGHSLLSNMIRKAQ
ncbi:proteasome regulatory particle base subunit [Blomia tropicalis]|nr:proteasome regulatory particle base subunit [Blomia tropicalis]